VRGWRSIIKSAKTSKSGYVPRSSHHFVLSIKFLQIIPHAVDYFTGKALEHEADEWDDEDEDDSDEAPEDSFGE